MDNKINDQTQVLDGLNEMKRGMGFLSGFIGTILAILALFQIIALVDVSALRFLGQLASKPMAWILFLITIGVLGAGMIFTRNGISKVDGGSAHGVILGSIGPNKLLATMSLVTFAISAFFGLLALSGVLGFRYMSLMIAPFMLFALSFFFYFIFMTYVAGSVGHAMKNDEMIAKARTTRITLLIVIIVTFLQYSMGSMMFDRDLKSLIQFIGIAAQCVGVYAHISNIQLWNHTAANYHEKAEVQGTQGLGDSTV